MQSSRCLESQKSIELRRSGSFSTRQRGSASEGMQRPSKFVDRSSSLESVHRLVPYGCLYIGWSRSRRCLSGDPRESLLSLIARSITSPQGHEASGIVESIGEGVTSVKPGKRDISVLVEMNFWNVCRGLRYSSLYSSMLQMRVLLESQDQSVPSCPVGEMPCSSEIDVSPVPRKDKV